MDRWDDFAIAAPELAEFATERLMVPPAYLATIRADGTPRVHPVTPIVGGGRLFLFMEPTSPKGRDLQERPWYALHNGVPDTHGSGGELWIRGEAVLVADRFTRNVAVEASTYAPADRYILFELYLHEVRCNGYGDVALPEPARWASANGDQ
jgi:hypothetical protein